jgi:glutathione S-transferase
MEPVAIVTALALVQYFWFGYLVSEARIRHGVNAPATSGHPEFDRCFRVHQNTAEQLLAFMPAVWIFGWYLHGLIAALIGAVFIAGRFVYQQSYMKDPSTRTLGAMMSGVATIVLLVGGLIGAIVGWIA